MKKNPFIFLISRSFERLFHLSIFTFLLVLGMASCGGNDGNDPANPEQETNPEEEQLETFQFKIDALSNKVQIKVTAPQKDTYFFAGYVSGEDLNNANGWSNYIEHNCLNHKFDWMVSLQAITKNSKVIQTPKNQELAYNKGFYAFAFFVEKDEETGFPKVVGDIVKEEFSTLPYWTLNGVFSVSETKKVRFATSNALSTDGDNRYCVLDQWTHQTDDSFVDRFVWTERNLLIDIDAGFSVLDGQEWLYLFLERKNADALLTLGTVNDVPGLILLPDDWQKPYDVKLKTARDLNFTWDPEIKSYMKLGSDGQMDDTFDGFSQNKYDLKGWEKLEFSGAVFLPAVSEGHTWYWTSSDIDYDLTHIFSIAMYELDLVGLHSPYDKEGKYYIRPVRELK